MSNFALAGFAPLAALGDHWQVRAQTAGSLLAKRSVRFVRRSGRMFVPWVEIWRAEGIIAPHPDDYDLLRMPLLRREEVATRYGVSQRTARRWMSNGALPTIHLSPRILRVRESELDRLDAPQLVQNDAA